MFIDLTKEEWEFLERMVKRAIILIEMKNEHFQAISDIDYLKASALLEKFIKGNKN